jgi:hypothetical protein
MANTSTGKNLCISVSGYHIKFRRIKAVGLILRSFLKNRTAVEYALVSAIILLFQGAFDFYFDPVDTRFPRP